MGGQDESLDYLLCTTEQCHKHIGIIVSGQVAGQHVVRTNQQMGNFN